MSFSFITYIVGACSVSPLETKSTEEMNHTPNPTEEKDNSRSRQRAPAWERFSSSPQKHYHKEQVKLCFLPRPIPHRHTQRSVQYLYITGICITRKIKGSWTEICLSLCPTLLLHVPLLVLWKAPMAGIGGDRPTLSYYTAEFRLTPLKDSHHLRDLVWLFSVILGLQIRKGIVVESQ